MQKAGQLGESIRAFFEATENKNLFRNCPFRRELSQLHELDSGSVANILGHMLGHILDYKAGQTCRAESEQEIPAINQDGLSDELRYVYNDCNNIPLSEERKINPAADPNNKFEYSGFGPEQRGCFGTDAQAELMAEAIRAYMQNPNYLKTVAPNVAARIREAVNPNPALRHIIQFN